MAFGIPADRQSQVMLLIIVGALTGGYFFWTGWHEPAAAKISATRSEIDSLQLIVDRAKADLASGTVEDLRRKVEKYQALLGVMRRLVPEKNEVPALIDDISTKAKVRGVTIARLEPLAVEPGHPFDTHRYRMEILGHYDQLGEFLSDIASLPRIIVPHDVNLKAAQQQAQRVLGDTTGALLEAQFMIRTFVKAPAPPAPKQAASVSPVPSGRNGARLPVAAEGQ
jgi:type IV pilus assembly protein PilO